MWQRGRRETWLISSEPLKLIGAVVAVAALGLAGTLMIQPREPAGQARAAETAEAAHVEAALGRSGDEGLDLVRRLCAPEFAGRKAGTPGGDRAGEWLAAKFKQLGLEPVEGAPGFLHRFTMPVSLLASRWDRKAKLVGRGPRAARRSETALVEYPCFRGGGFSAEAEAIFAGWGVSRRDQGWDDFQGTDVRGRYVVYWEGAPGRGLDRETHTRWRDAKARGALGCLVLSRRPEAGPAGLQSPISDFPVLRLDPATAGRILSTPIPPPGSPSGRKLASLRIEIPRAVDPARPVANVIGMIPGADPELADEVVILSAHYDHLGSSQVTGAGAREAGGQKASVAGHQQKLTTDNARLTTFPGADDDASGVAVVLGVARALRAAGARPRRSILFCLWTAEECGLVGSRAYVQRPLAPLEKTRFVLQVEMVGAGRPDSFETSSARLSGSGHKALQAAADRLRLTLAGDDCRGASDHLPFVRRGVPALVVTTTGDHPDYHTPRDTPDRLRPAGIRNATRLCALALWRSAISD